MSATSPKPPLLPGVIAAIATLATSLWTISLNVVGFIILGLIIFIFWKLIATNEIIIDPISVPRALTERGYSDQIAAKQLQSVLIDEAKSLAPPSDKYGYVTASDAPSIAIPTFGMSVDALVGNIKSFILNKSPNVIGGEFVEKDGMVTLYLRVSGKQVFSASSKLTEMDMRALYRQAVPSLFKVTNSYFYAASLVSKPDDGDRAKNEEEALDIIDNILTFETNKHESYVVAWAYNLKAAILLYKLDKAGGRDEAKIEAEALESIRKSLVYKPDYSYAYLNAGMFYYRRGADVDRAISFLRSAIKSDRRLAEAHRYLAKALQKANRMDEAYQSYRTVISIERTNHRGYQEYAEALATNLKFDEAIAQYQEIINRSKNDPQAMAAAYHGIASAKLADDRAIEAESYVTKAIELASRSEAYVITYIKLLQAQDRHTEATYWRRRLQQLRYGDRN